MTDSQHISKNAPVTIGLSKSVPEHILANDDPICGDTDYDTNTESRLVEVDADPLSESSLHLCPDCADEWMNISNDITRAKTVQCLCDRIEDGNAYTCGTIVPATEARALKHPDTDEKYVPVCADCYKWILNRKVSPISLSYEEAKPWAELTSTHD